MSNTPNKRAYAANSSVPIWRSKDAITEDLQRLGTVRQAFYDDSIGHHAAIVFELGDTRYRLRLPLPDPQASVYQWSPAHRIRRTPRQAHEAWEQDSLERWRALAAYVKALRIAAEAGIIDTREALLSYALLPDGRTVAEYTLPQLAEAAATDRMPPLLPGVSAAPALPALPAARIREEHEEEGNDR